MASSLYEWGISVPWCITTPALDAMLAIAAREDIDADDLKQAMHGPKSLALRDGQRREGAAHTENLGPIARIAIDGPIYRYADYFTKYSGGVTTEALAKEFQAALDDPAVRAIAFVIDSPGGEAAGINELADTIYAARGKKPIGAYIEGYGASAAYWIASAADTVIVDESALVGSIGTVMGVLDPTKRARYTIDFVSTQSPKKRVDPTTPDGQAYLQSLVDAMTEVFIEKVMRNRNMTRGQVLDVEGGMRIGAAAVASGLADRIGSEDQLIQSLATGARPLLPTPPARVPGRLPLHMEEPMQIFSKEWWGNLFAAQAELEPDASPPIATPPLASVAPDPQLQQRLDELEAQIDAQQAQARQAQALSFADGAVRSRHAMPAEHAALAAAYLQAAEDDAARPTDPPRTSRLEALVSSRTPHTLSDELIATNDAGALPSGAAQTFTAERRAALLSLTPTGQAVLDRHRA